MVAEVYETVLEELAKVLEIEKLVPDVNNSCLVKLKNGVEIQVEPDESGHFLVIGSSLGEVLEGHYRESLFEAALKHNGQPYPRHGTLAFSSQTSNLILFKMVPLYNLSGPVVAQQVASISAKAAKWKEAIAKNDIPSLDHLGPTRSTGMFNLKP